MSAAVMLSIRPKWCELIASGRKTVEVRKTRPKLQTPFRCYIYMTSGNASIQTLKGTLHYSGGQCVIGEFVCDNILDCRDVPIGPTCITVDEWRKYTDDHKGLVYGWHISDLVIYDTPKGLSEFYVEKDATTDYPMLVKMKRPPQSWCYVEGGQKRC